MVVLPLFDGGLSTRTTTFFGAVMAPLWCRYGAVFALRWSCYAAIVATSGSDWACQKCAATKELIGPDALVSGAVRFASFACASLCLAYGNGSLWLHHIRCATLWFARLLFPRRNGCFLAPFVAFALRRRRAAVACAGHRRSWSTWSGPGGGRGV